MFKNKIMKYNLINLAFLIVPIFCIGQKSTITFLDELSKKPIIGLQIFSENGSFIGNTNSLGKFELNIQLLQQGNINKILAYNTDYFSLEYKLKEVPPIIYLNKNEVVQLKEVAITTKKSKEKYVLNGFFRSWQLVNGKLVKYGDGIVNYHVPYAEAVNDFNTGIKSYFIAYRTFKVDSIKQKSRFVSISTFDEYLSVSSIPKNDMLKRGKKYYSVKHVKDNLSDIYEDQKKVGYVIYDKNSEPVEINTSKSFEGDEAIKILFWKITGSYKEIERWSVEGNTRHPSYLFNSKKSVVKTKTEEIYNNVETITEVFIENEIINNENKLENSKTILDKDRSFYKSNYWDNQLMKHPLPSEIKLQLINVNENKNSYR